MSLTATDIHELLGREVDEIEDVRRCFEGSYGVYNDPTDGDFISDDYEKVIDLSTQPDSLSGSELRSLNRAVKHLNAVYPTIEDRLGSHGLLGAYQNVAEQVNVINASAEDAGRHMIDALQAAPLGEVVATVDLPQLTK